MSKCGSIRANWSAGDAWDAKILGQIASCALFLPVISANTEARLEGYFRLEWKLAAQRTHTMADEKAFLLPVAIDETRDITAKVPAEFKAVQWTRLRPADFDGQALNEPGLAAFCARVTALLGTGPQMETGRPHSVQSEEGAAMFPTKQRKARWLLPAILGFVALLALALWQPWKKSVTPETKLSASAMVSSSNAKAVAVLPFANRSGDQEQEYFSDGLTEEILGALRREHDLSVPGNTSCFAFKGKTVSPAEIARALNVSRLVEGSVQRVGSKVRIRVTLSRPADNSSEELGTFTEELADIFALQDKVARAVVAKLTRRASTTAPVVVLTKIPEAYDAYLRGRTLQTSAKASSDVRESLRAGGRTRSGVCAGMGPARRSAGAGLFRRLGSESGDGRERASRV